MNKPPLNPHSVICVCKHDGKEVGRIAATAPNAEAYMTELTRCYGSLEVEYVEDPDGAIISRMLSSKLN